MTTTWERICSLIAKRDYRLSSHGADRIDEVGVIIGDFLATIDQATVLEDYPDYPKGSCVLVLQHDRHGRPFHLVWGIPKGYDRPAVLVTIYRPDEHRWTDDLMGRL